MQSAVLLARMEMEARLVKHTLFLARPAVAAPFRMLSLFIFISLSIMFNHSSEAAATMPAVPPEAQSFLQDLECRECDRGFKFTLEMQVVPVAT